MVSVEQCASLFLLEDFLRNRIKTIDDVKTLKAPQSYLGEMKASTSQPSKAARPIFEQTLDQMRDLLDIQGSRETIRQEHDEFSRSLMERLYATKELTEQDHVDILRQLEVHSLQMMDDFYADLANEDQYDDGGASGDNLQLEERMYEFQRTINRLREDHRKYKLKAPPQAKASSEDATMKDEEQPSSTSLQSEESKHSSEEKLKRRGSDVEMTDEDEE